MTSSGVLQWAWRLLPDSLNAGGFEERNLGGTAQRNRDVSRFYGYSLDIVRHSGYASFVEGSFSALISQVSAN